MDNAKKKKIAYEHYLNIENISITFEHTEHYKYKYKITNNRKMPHCKLIT